ncbi:MAG TPA: alpha/beta hydrolase family protein [Chitinophagaceae bacterium]|nr:alpha/beta hydrolase family protein [Chitinophagaceae bacterium]
MKKYVLWLCILFSAPGLRAATVDTVSIYSNAMHKSIRCVVIHPDSKEALPVVYLLHGYSGNFSNWIMKVPRLKQYADEYRLLIVCPDGDYGSWYFDSPVDSSMRYETYIAKEVPAWIDAHYSTIKDRRARAITGLSMGGHGGLFLAFRHAETFGACGSMSGGVDLNSARTKFDISKRIGDTIRYVDNWKRYSVINIVEKYPKDSLSIIFDCGTEDFFYPDNHALHEKMLRLKIPHDYIERPGKHDWMYWGNAVEYQLLFFKEYFSGRENK